MVKENYKEWWLVHKSDRRHGAYDDMQAGRQYAGRQMTAGVMTCRRFMDLVKTFNEIILKNKKNHNHC